MPCAHCWAPLLTHGYLQEDVGALYAARDPEEYGRARLSHVADTWKGKLDPAEYLNPGRHGEWTAASGARPAHNPAAAKYLAAVLNSYPH